MSDSESTHEQCVSFGVPCQSIALAVIGLAAMLAVALCVLTELGPNLLVLMRPLDGHQLLYCT